MFFRRVLRERRAISSLDTDTEVGTDTIHLWTVSVPKHCSYKFYADHWH